MAKLTEIQIEKIKEHMLHEEQALKIKFKAKRTEYDTKKVLHSEVDAYENKGWMVKNEMKTKTVINRKKEHNRQFEDDIWCMFYNLKFSVLNADENLRVQWGPHPEDNKQLDIVAVGNDAIFVVECKSAEVFKPRSFRTEIIEMCNYKNGISESLQQIYGKDKRVKFIFATRNSRVGDEDKQRMKENSIYHLEERAYDYICNLIKSYQSSVIYQFYGLMFKDELISEKPITIPALKGKMGNKVYYLFSIEPETLLKIGFVLHRTKVNDSLAPTYQRLLVPKRLKGITKFIDDGGYFPNSIILNFSDSSDNIKVTFDPIHKEEDSDAEFGLLNIPNAYGIAYIIDGQHRVYGYSNSKFKNIHTIPVVAFQGMPSEEQLKIFMEINENQKSVSKNLRIDLEQDLLWTSKNLDSRMKALRSSIIKMLNDSSNSVLFNKISIGEDSASLSSVFFNNALSQSGLIPKATHAKWVDDSNTCLFDKNNTNIEEAMKESRQHIFQYINGCYEIADKLMDEDTKSIFLFKNRATFPFVTLTGLLHSYLCNIGELDTNSSIKDCIIKVEPYISALCDGLSSLPDEEITYLTGAQGQGAEKAWLLAYQNIINKAFPGYEPEELREWRETRDQSIQEEGEKSKGLILNILRQLVIVKLQEIYGANYLKNIAKLKHDCEGKIIDAYGDNEDFDIGDYDWKDFMEISDCKEIIDKNFSYDVISETFGISLSDRVSSKKERLRWMSLIEPQKGKKKKPLTKSDINRLWLIHDHLAKFLPTEE